MNTLQLPGWITRILITVITITLLVIGFFFLTVALAVGAIVALVIGVHFWWTIRKLKRTQSAADSVAGRSDDPVVEGEYQVVERDSGTAQLPPERR